MGIKDSIAAFATYGISLVDLLDCLLEHFKVDVKDIGIELMLLLARAF
jgi:hypothetical protein